MQVLRTQLAQAQCSQRQVLQRPRQAQAQCDQQLVQVLRTQLAQARCIKRQVQVQRHLKVQAQCTHARVQEKRKTRGPECTFIVALVPPFALSLGQFSWYVLRAAGVAQRLRHRQLPLSLARHPVHDHDGAV